MDAVALPFRIVFLPLAFLGRVTAKAAGVAADLTRPRRPSVFVKLAEEGFKPRFGEIGPRSSFAAGLLFDRWMPFYLEGSYSIRGSQRYQIGLDLERPLYRAQASYLFTRDAEPYFWGVGVDTNEDQVVAYQWDQQLASATATFRPLPWTLIGGLGYQDNRVDRPSARVPDIQDVPGIDSLYGVNQRTEYAVLNFSAVLDNTSNPGFQRRGWLVELGSSLFRGVDGTNSDFRRFRGVATGYAPLNPRQAAALRAIVEVNKSDGGEGVPFTHLAALGDEAGNRAYQDGRFRHLSMAAVMTEWRYEVWRELQERGRVESYLLLDTGTVQENLLDTRFSDLRWSFGFGFRVVWNRQLRWLVYLAFGGDGPRVNFDFSSVY